MNSIKGFEGFCHPVFYIVAVDMRLRFLGGYGLGMSATFHPLGALYGFSAITRDAGRRALVNPESCGNHDSLAQPT